MNFVKLLLITLTVGQLRAFNNLCFRFTETQISPFLRTQTEDEQIDEDSPWNMTFNPEMNGLLIQVMLTNKCSFLVQFKIIQMIDDGVKPFVGEMCGPCVDESEDLLSEINIFFNDERSQSDKNSYSTSKLRYVLTRLTPEQSYWSSTTITKNANRILV